MQALNKRESWDSCDAMKTSNLENSISKAKFIVSLLMLEKVSSLILPAPRSLQKVECDFMEAMYNITT